MQPRHECPFIGARTDMHGPHKKRFWSHMTTEEGNGQLPSGCWQSVLVLHSHRPFRAVKPRGNMRVRRHMSKEPLISCDSGMQGKASRSETRGLSWR